MDESASATADTAVDSGGAAADERAIRTATARFADIVNRGSIEELRGVWAASGVWALPSGDVEGIDAICAMLTSLLANHQRLVQLVASGEVIVTGESAVCRWYVTEIAIGQDGITRTFAGAYDDALAKSGGRWLFTRRMYQPLLRLSGQIEASAVPWSASALS